MQENIISGKMFPESYQNRFDTAQITRQLFLDFPVLK